MPRGQLRVKTPDSDLRRLYELEDALARVRAEVARQLKAGGEYPDSGFVVHEAVLIAPLQRSVLPYDAEFTPELDIRIMRRLLDDSDLEWLKSQGIDAKFIMHLRCERRALFSQWVRVLREESRAELRRQKEFAAGGATGLDRLLRNHIAISKNLLLLSICAGLHAFGFSFVQWSALGWLHDIERRLLSQHEIGLGTQGQIRKIAAHELRDGCSGDHRGVVGGQRR